MGDVRLPADGVLRRADATGGRELSHFRPNAAARTDPRPGTGEMGGRQRQPRPGPILQQRRAKGSPFPERPRPLQSGPAPRRPAGRLPRSGRGQARRPVPRRRLPDRLRHVEQHERQRGDRQSGHRIGRRRSLQRRKADPSERSRQPGPEHQRRVSHGHPRGRRRGDPRTVDSRLGASAARCWPRKPTSGRTF